MHPSTLFFFASPATSHHLFLPKLPHLSSRQLVSCPRKPRFYASSQPNDSPTPNKIQLPDTDSLPLDLPTADLNPEQATAAAQALFDDLAGRPEYYLNVSGVLLGIALSCVVLSATVIALDTIPLIPDVLRIIGLAYLFWFLNKFLFSAVERENLAQQVSEFVAGVRGPDFADLEEPQHD